ncbi:uncharacterized protein BO80DRAFT_428068 [Aspergillus ibericus CBS 121593]|uniref:Uncharacterized protein n=1 Tax=Aspergillus ibericus CBS 121593 TaxID=1448316 RepID=A0A395GQ46_9EURO|nr:hypothetical protein BO80DRAFT_428068 [Aspergillus ibericus CBS 121593]RAK97599.1 hypothetical protein BO80DRAFT_428068 [Aspergillus ibericus CBS 121593]
MTWSSAHRGRLGTWKRISQPVPPPQPGFVLTDPVLVKEAQAEPGEWVPLSSDYAG